MPTTRALSARLMDRQSSENLNSADDDIAAIKARQSSIQQDLAIIRLPSQLSGSDLAKTRTKPQLSRYASLSSTGKLSALSSSSNSSTKSNSGRLSPRRSASSFSSKRSILGSENMSDSEPSDDELGFGRDRLGGCSQQSQASTDPDDSNKENVAPFRCASEDVLMQEARDAQEETAARRTRTRRSSLMERQGVTVRHAKRRMSVVSTITTSSLSLPRTPSSKRTMTRTRSENCIASSLASMSKKRSRGGQHDDDDDSSLPASPLSKLRLSPSKGTSRIAEEEVESYFCSQRSSSTVTSSLFDTLSQDGTLTTITSRSTSPAQEQLHNKTSVNNQYSNVYAHARALLRYAAGVDPAETESGLTICGERQADSQIKVVGRAKERVAIEQFLDQRLGLFSHATSRAQELQVELDGDTESGCLYVSGLPGTGKTALVRSVLSDLSAAASTKARPPRIAFVNCMTLTHPRFVFGKVLSALGSDAAEGQSDVEAEKALSKLIKQGGQRILIVLDEMDHLLHSQAHQNVLYRLFSWATPAPSNGKPRSSSCSLIGIANSLDLTKRFVPLLASKGASPALLHFRPFEATEIVQVIRDRLTGLSSSYSDEVVAEVPVDGASKDMPLFTAPAVELLSKKIASATGDLRKALDTARLAVELVETEQRKSALVELSKVEDAPASVRVTLLNHLTPHTAAKAGPQQILKILSTVLGSPNLSKVRTLGLQPKLVLLSFLIASLRAKEGLPVLGGAGSNTPRTHSELRISEIESTYFSILKNDGSFTALESSELLGVFELLEVQGVLSMVETCGMEGTPSGKRAAKKQSVAGNRAVALKIAAEDVVKGLTTNSPVSETLAQIWVKESERVHKSRGWEAVAAEKAQVRREELGGGRGAIGL